ncbi:S24 family peptidase [Hymenobacter terricola]|uniref:S24 family peptidase n=1 Tax=Hymenobacter terricola TaxID=2819236 RepID=UPI001CF50D4D|nr:LexA family transcriptional regulator [Hymenobacter terricola]
MDFLTKWPDLSPAWLTLGEGPMLRSAGGGATATRVLGAGPGHAVHGFGRVLAVTVDAAGDENITSVPVMAQAGYTRQHNEPVFLRQLQQFRLPGFSNATYRAFEVEGDSMLPLINHGDFVICSVVERWDLLQPGRMYVVVTSESVMLKRLRARITDVDRMVTLYSDNVSVLPYELPAADITELWMVRGYLSTYIPSTPDVTAERLWQVFDLLGLDRGEVRRHLEENGPNSVPNR